jgi:RNA polymerase sigma-70 factor (ECF subfamily)
MNDPTPQEDLLVLMRSAQDGDASAYGRLLREVTPLLTATIRRSRPFLQQQDLDDLLQTILLALHEIAVLTPMTSPLRLIP